MTNHPHTAQQATLPRKRRPLVRTTSRERAFSGDATTSTATPRASSTRGPRTTMRRSTVALIPRFIAASAIALLLSAPAAAVNGKPAVDRDTVVFAISSDIGMAIANGSIPADRAFITGHPIFTK